MENHKSVETQSGTGAITYIIAHGCPIAPFYVTVNGVSPDSLYDPHTPAVIPFSYTWDNQNITLNYFAGAPQVGSNNLIWAWEAECS